MVPDYAASEFNRNRELLPAEEDGNCLTHPTKGCLNFQSTMLETERKREIEKKKKKPFIILGGAGMCRSLSHPNALVNVLMRLSCCHHMKKKKTIHMTGINLPSFIEYGLNQLCSGLHPTFSEVNKSCKIHDLLYQYSISIPNHMINKVNKIYDRT